MAKDTVKPVAQNRRAHHDYFLEELYEAGLALSGTEVKSLRAGKCSLKESYVAIEHGEAYIYNMHISPYEHGNIFNKDPLRTRKLLLHRAEIRKLDAGVKIKGYTIVPLEVYLDHGLVKVLIGLAHGKKLYDKREDLKKRDMKRDAELNVKKAV